MYPRNSCSKQEKGAITVFLALIFMSLILFAGMVIDISRIAAAERKVQSVLNSSARSVLAGYDRELAGGYGIYGINAASDSIKDDFYRYITVNLKERHRGISFLDIEVSREDVEIQGMDSLLGEEPFKDQIQEYMKYRTVINVSDSLIEQLKNIKLDKKVDFAKSEKVTRDKARELRTKVNAVNAKLAVVKKKLADLSAEKLEDIKKELSEALTISGYIHGENGAALLEEYNNSREDSKSKAEDGGCIENQSLEFQNIRVDSENLAPVLQRHLSEVGKSLQIISPLKEELEDLKDELSDLKDELSDICEDKESSSESKNRIKDEIDEVEDRIKLLESRIGKEISRLKTALRRIPLEGYTLKNEAVKMTEKNAEELKSSIKNMKKEIEASLLRSLKKEWLISAEEFDGESHVTGGDFGLMDENSDYNLSIKEEDAEKDNDTIVKSMEKLAKAIENAASSAAEKVNTIEYVMENFTFLTSKTERNHYFRKGEVEYIISGADTAEAGSQIKNTEYYLVTNVFLQVWALRFAIDTIDDFIGSTIVFPPQRLAFALAEGALDSSQDMLEMMNGEGVSICPKSFTGVKLKYSDHLRILLLMKPEEEILRKVRQLMQVNIKQIVDINTGVTKSDFRLGDYSTVISAAVEVRVNLYFLPMFKVDKLLPESFEGGRYVIRKKIYVCY